MQVRLSHQGLLTVSLDRLAHVATELSGQGPGLGFAEECSKQVWAFLLRSVPLLALCFQRHTVEHCNCHLGFVYPVTNVNNLCNDVSRPPDVAACRAYLVRMEPRQQAEIGMGHILQHW